MGMMDGLITLLGILMGVGAATGDAQLVIISGLVGGIANSFGTSVGFYTSEQAERGQQIEFYKKKRNVKIKETSRYIHSKTEIYLETGTDGGARQENGDWSPLGTESPRIHRRRSA